MAGQQVPEFVFFRCEASHTLGFGHLSRCLLLAQAFEAQGMKPVFLFPESDIKAIEMVGAKGWNVYRLPAGLSYEEELSQYPETCRILITDLHHMGNIKAPSALTRYLGRALEGGIFVTFIDGLFGEAYRPENGPELPVLVQPYLGAEHDEMPQARHWLKGGQYAIMGPDYAGHPAKEIKVQAENLLITFGGADPQGWTVSVMQELSEESPGLTIRVIVGPYFSDSHKQEIEKIAGNFSGRFEILPPQTSMIVHYEWADMALGASSLSRYEFAALGVPAIFAALYDEHKKLSEVFAEYGTARYLGLYADLEPGAWQEAVRDLQSDQPARLAMSSAGQSCIDGQGAERLVKDLLEIFEDEKAF